MWFPKNTTQQEKFDYYVSTVGLSEMEAQILLTPFSQYVKGQAIEADRIYHKVLSWIEKENEKFQLENPKWKMSFTERLEYEAKEQKKTEDTQHIGIGIEEPAFPSKEATQ